MNLVMTVRCSSQTADHLKRKLGFGEINCYPQMDALGQDVKEISRMNKIIIRRLSGQKKLLE